MSDANTKNSARDSEPRDSEPPLFRAEALRLADGSLESPESIQTTGSSLALIGRAGGLVPALCELVALESGSLTVRGQSPSLLLSSHKAGYAPRSLPLPGRARLGEALKMSASLVGVDKTAVEISVERCHLTAYMKKPLGELTRLQSRLAGLAHAISGQPEILFLEDLFSDLDETEAEVIETVLEAELLDRSWICAIDPEGRSARSILMMADEVIGTTGNRLIPPMSPQSLPSGGFWVVCQGDLEAFVSRLEGLGAKVARSPHEGVLRVHGPSGLQLFRAAKTEGTQILELSPFDTADTGSSHARSEA
jgi:hypothetical protein